MLLYYCKQRRFHNENQPYRDLFHKILITTRVHYLATHCSATLKRQLQTNKTQYVLGFSMDGCPKPQRHHPYFFINELK